MKDNIRKFTIEQARNYAGLSREAFAAAIGVHPSTLENYEAYKTIMKMDTAYRVSEVTGLDIDEIIFFEHKVRKTSSF